MSAAARKLRTEALPLPEELPAAVLQRLAAQGITTVAQWRALGRRRREIFGLTARMVARVEAAMKAPA